MTRALKALMVLPALALAWAVIALTAHHMALASTSTPHARPLVMTAQHLARPPALSKLGAH